MKKKYLMLTILSCLAANAQVQWPEAKIEVHIVDESGQAISNASTTIWFTKLKTNNPFDGQDNIVFRGLSDGGGNFSAISQTLGLCGAGAEKDGYYPSRVETRLGKNIDNKWVPWHRTLEVKLRKKESPTAMYARKLYLKPLPANEIPIGYDLWVGDWVSPHGRGAKSDLVFKLHRDYQSRYKYEWDLSIHTPREGDGLDPISPAEETPQSQLRFPKTAPEGEYGLTQLLLGLKSDKGDRSKNNFSATNFFFRVRTELDEHKQVKRAFYGRLIGPIIVDVHDTKTANLRFAYYLNPEANSRNMEFDPKKNLFKNLSGMEEVHEP